MAALHERLFGKVMPLKEQPMRKDISVVGMSDASVYSELLQAKFDYTNTFFHKQPFLDITKPDPGFQHEFDVVISSDVLEHVAPPVEMAFQGLHSLLRESGLLVLTVPFGLQDENIEHFADLYDYEIVGTGAKRRLMNVTRHGEKQVFSQLCFHGGDGATLEMRIFSQAGLIRLLEASGFHDIRMHSGSLPEWGIVNFTVMSVQITAIAGKSN